MNVIETQSERLSAEAVAVATGLSMSTLWRWVKAGKFPAPNRTPGRHRAYWTRSDVDAWLAMESVGSR